VCVRKPASFLTNRSPKYVGTAVYCKFMFGGVGEGFGVSQMGSEDGLCSKQEERFL
jgi:hypothetical protein